jgi:hypothetical protein
MPCCQSPNYSQIYATFSSNRKAAAGGPANVNPNSFRTPLVQMLRLAVSILLAQSLSTQSIVLITPMAKIANDY